MAMIFMDGYDYLTVANATRKWTSLSGSLGTGVYGFGKCVTNSNGQKNLPSNFTEFYQGFHFYTGTTLTDGIITQWLDGGTNQVELRIGVTGALRFTRNNTLLGSASSSLLSTNTWYWIEVHVKIDASAGIAACYVNSTSFLNLTSQNTKNSSNAYINVLKTGTITTTGSLDSFHFWDGTAGDVTSFPYGEHAIDTRLPNANGSNSDWTRNTGSNNYEAVDEANSDDDTTYVSSATADQIDSYGFENFRSTSGSIGTVAINTIARIDDATPRTFKHYAKSASATSLSADFTPSSGFNNQQSFVGTDPNTSSAWAIADLNAAEFGQKLIT